MSARATKGAQQIKSAVGRQKLMVSITPFVAQSCAIDGTLLFGRFGRTILGDVAYDAGLINLDDDIGCDFQLHGVLLHFADDAVDATGADDFITLLETVLACFELFLLLLLRADEQEIEDNTDEQERCEHAQGAAFLRRCFRSGRGGSGLGGGGVGFGGGSSGGCLGEDVDVVHDMSLAW